MPNREVAAAKPVIVEESSYDGYAGKLRVRIHRPTTQRATSVLALYLHPGRFIAGDLDATDDPARALAVRLSIAVAVPAYSLATAQPFPAAAEDAYAALVWAHTHGVQKRKSTRRIVVIGEEAGGNLAAALAMMSRDRGGPPLAAQVLIAPMLDPTLSSCSMRAGDAKATSCSEAYRCYLPRAADRLHPYAAPALSTRLAGLAPALILSMQDDPLRDEAETYGAKLIAAGVKTHVTRLPTRGWSEAMWQEIAEFLTPLLLPPRHRRDFISSTAK
jgi:acetyl esterase/lipase